jgi:phenylacetate-coenzyme A ligase PaaK-like adenylate-forming protein
LSLKKFIALGRAKKAVKEFDWVTEHPMECQEAFVAKLATLNRDTLFGRKHKLEKVRSVDDYQKLVPIHDYHALLRYVELIRNGKKDILFHGTQIWWAKTSGTTSEPKLIPITKEMTKYNSDAGSRLMYSFIMENPKENLDVISGKLFFLRAPSRVDSVNGIPVGYISGISGETQSRFAKHMVVPSKETSEIADWEDKFYKATLETIQENVTMIVGVTPLLMSVFQRMADEYPEQLLHDVKNKVVKERIRRAMRKGGGRLLPVDCWENLKLFCPTSASIKPYILRYRDLFGDTPIREAYGATEGQFGHEDGQGKGLLLNWDKYLYEFLPFDEYARSSHSGDTDDRLTVTDLKVGDSYELLVTTPFGLYSYRIGDVLRLESKDPHRFTIVGRTKMTLNIFGEKVCEEHISTALRVAEETTRAVVSEFSCMALASEVEGPRYVMCVEFIKPPKNKQKFITTWDEKLQEVAPAYGCFRVKDAILKAPRIITLLKGAFQRYEQKQMRSQHAIGQLKPPHITDTRELLSELSVSPSVG